MKTILTLSLCVFVVQITFALTETVDGTVYSYWIENNEAVIGNSKWNSVYNTYDAAINKDIQGTLVIPAQLGGCDVVKIAERAFYQCTNITEIIFSDNIHSVGNQAFCGCNSLSAVKIGNKVESLGNSAFGYCPNLTQIVIPASVTNVDEDVFISGSYEHNYLNTVSKSLTEILFMGDCPTVIDQANHLGLFYGYGDGPKVYIVEGSNGWPDMKYYYPNGVSWYGFYWQGGAVQYGAVRVAQQIGANTIENQSVIDVNECVALTCINNSATLYYTIDGSEPTTDSMVYSSPIPLTKRTTIKAIAVVPSYPYTITETCSYAFGQTAVPSATMEVGNTFYLSGSEVTLACETEGAEIRYTLDGREPTKESLLYTEPFPIDDTTIVRAKAFKEDWFDSETATTTFTREWYTVATPVIEPDGGEIVNTTQEVSISCETDGATIYYTLDGSVPNRENGFEYRHSFNVSKSCTIRAVAIKDDWKDSEVVESVLTRNESLSEAANLFGYTMETDGDATWSVDDEVSRDGVSAVKSGVIGNNENTYLQTSVKKAGSVSFWWCAMCEENDGEEPEEYYDYGAFLVDGAVVARIAGHDGEWRKVRYDITTGGKHTLRWEYRKDGATSYAPDCIWVDCVQWVPADDSGVTLTTPVEIPYTWLKKYELGEETDFETVGNGLSGKTQGGKATSVWQEYVMGTDPTNEVSQFKAEIKFEDGVPKVEWDPDLNAGGEELRVYKVFGKENLFDADWTYPTNSLHRFFKVTVEMP